MKMRLMIRRLFLNLSMIALFTLCFTSCETNQPQNQDVFKNVFGKTFDQTTDELWEKLTGQSKTPSPTRTEIPTVPTVNLHKPISVFSNTPYFGISPFPYDATIEAIQNTQNLTKENSTLYSLQLDNGIPWKEAFENKPWPQSFQKDDWDAQLRPIPDGRPRYVSISPLREDRITLARPGRGSSYPFQFNEHSSLNNPNIKQAYLNYVRRVVLDFRPQYLNIGQEAGDLAHHAPSKWPAFFELYEFVRSSIKKEFPEIQIGISYGLPFLMTSQTAELVHPAVLKSDYLGLSFYPYSTQFYEKMRGAALPEGPESWRTPLTWVKNYAADKPIAMCETAYLSEGITLKKFGLTLTGSLEMQKSYVEEIFQIARNDHYLFVTWFAVVDFDQLHEKLMKNDEASLMWMRSGFLSSNLQPKPAWQAWKDGLKNER